jgi:magnesium chelatase subunit D
MRGTLLPFSGVVGQEQMKLALVLNAVNPAIGGVLIRGHRGTAKSTAVRALARLLPTQAVVVGCRFGCDPADRENFCRDCADRSRGGGEPLRSTTRRMRVVELPMNVSSDRLVGTIDLEAALRHGVKRFEPGVLAEANRNILYVDEVNLLDDHIVDVLLDAAATGVNVVERDGLSLQHPARFILVGTMNPEEGELRPQLLDRFGLCVDVTASLDVNERIEIAERDVGRAGGCCSAFEAADRLLEERIQTGLELLRSVELRSAQTRLIATECLHAGVQGHRADLVCARTAKALASYRGRSSLTKGDIYDALEMALSHRARTPLQRPVDGQGDDAEGDRVESDAPDQDLEQSKGQPAPQDAGENGSGAEPPGGDETAADHSDGDSRADSGEDGNGPAGAEPRGPQPEKEFVARNLELTGLQQPRRQSGKRAMSISKDKRGRYVYARTQQQVTDLALDATLLAAAPHQGSRGRHEGERLVLERHDLRQKVRKRKVGNLIVFAVDASGSMNAEKRMGAAKGAALSLLQDAYVRRDKVAVVVFRNRSADVVMPPTGGANLAKRRLADVPVGGKTPLGQGLLAAYQLIRTEKLKDATLRPLLILVSDGHGNVSVGKGDPNVEARQIAARILSDGIESIVVDSTIDFSDPIKDVRNGSVYMYQNYSRILCRRLAEEMGARYCGLQDLARDLPAFVRNSSRDGG